MRWRQILVRLMLQFIHSTIMEKCSNSTRYKTHASAIQNVIECISAYDQAIKYKYNNKYTTFFTPTV